MVLEVHLNDLVAQTEHDRMLGLQPLFHVSWILFTGLQGGIRRIWLLTGILQIRSEMLQQSDLLLQLLGKVCERMSLHDILLLLVDKLSLEVVEGLPIDVQNNLSRIIEEDARSTT